jgi:hypothetical protein
VINPTDVVNSMVTTLQSIPTLTALLVDGTKSIVGYIDENPLKNSVLKARYQMAQGSLMLVWNGVTLAEVGSTIFAWKHAVMIYVKSQKTASDLDLIEAIIQGIPIPGGGLRWRYCPIMTGMLPTEVTAVNRITDQEGIDYFVVVTSTQETGDT